MMWIWIPPIGHLYSVCAECDCRKREKLAGGEKTEPDALICILDLVSYSPSSEPAFSYANSLGLTLFLFFFFRNKWGQCVKVALVSFALTSRNGHHFLTIMVNITLTLSSRYFCFSCLETLLCCKSFFYMRI